MTDEKDIFAEPTSLRGEGQHVGSVATLVSSGLPLEAGLRALSEEAPTRRVRRSLRRIADELAAGQSADEVLSRDGRGLSRYLRSLVQAGVRSGQLGPYLEEFIFTTRRRRSARQHFLLSLSYPLLLLPLAILGVSFLVWFIVPQFKDIFNDFGVELPAVTMVLIRLSDFLTAPVILSLPLVILGAYVLLLLMPSLIGGAVWTRFVQHVPLVGIPSRMRGMSEFCSFLGLLVSGGIPLPEALEVTSDALHDANLRSGAKKLADRVADGRSMYEAAGGMPHFSSDLQSLFHWENRGSSFGDMLRQAGRVFNARSQVQLGIVGLVFQPLLLLFVAGGTGFAIIALFMPLIKLLNDLS